MPASADPSCTSVGSKGKPFAADITAGASTSPDIVSSNRPSRNLSATACRNSPPIPRTKRTASSSLISAKASLPPFVPCRASKMERTKAGRSPPSAEMIPCNYFQSAENIMDDVHVNFAHRDHLVNTAARPFVPTKTWARGNAVRSHAIPAARRAHRSRSTSSCRTSASSPTRCARRGTTSRSGSRRSSGMCRSMTRAISLPHHGLSHEAPGPSRSDADPRGDRGDPFRSKDVGRRREPPEHHPHSGRRVDLRTGQDRRSLAGTIGSIGRGAGDAAPDVAARAGIACRRTSP